MNECPYCGKYCRCTPEPKTVQTVEPSLVQIACDSCTLGVMDADNPHLTGKCNCKCHH